MLQEFGTFLKLLLSKWGAGVFLTLDALAFFAGALFPQLVLPTWVYWAIAGAVFFWSSFGVYRDLTKELATYKTPSEVKVEPKLSIELVDGNEYTYSIDPKKHYQFWQEQRDAAEVALQEAREANDEEEIEEQKSEITRATRKMVQLEPSDYAPDSKIRLHIRISNVGAISVDILHVNVRYASVDPWGFLPADIFDPNGVHMTYPRSLPPKALLLIDGVSTVTYREPSPASLAAKLGNVTTESPHNVTAQVTVQAISVARQQVTLTKEFQIASRPLKDLYLSRWQEKGLTELLRLAQAGD